MRRKILITVGVLLILGMIVGAIARSARYWIRSEKAIPMEAIGTRNSPQSPTNKSSFYNRYPHRSLKVKDEKISLFTFTLDSKNPGFAPIALHRLKGRRGIDPKRSAVGRGGLYLAYKRHTLIGHYILVLER